MIWAISVQSGTSPECPVKILKNCDPLIVSTYMHPNGLNFLRHFLSRGFLRHMQDNELHHDVFGFTPRKRETFSIKEKGNHVKLLMVLDLSMVSSARIMY